MFIENERMRNEWARLKTPLKALFVIVVHEVRIKDSYTKDCTHTEAGGWEQKKSPDCHNRRDVYQELFNFLCDWPTSKRRLCQISQPSPRCNRAVSLMNQTSVEKEMND